ncbi:MAG: hypothetical protein ACFB6R_05250 [Alphaproteobacteria bacterium]
MPADPSALRRLIPSLVPLALSVPVVAFAGHDAVHTRQVNRDDGTAETRLVAEEIDGDGRLTAASLLNSLGAELGHDAQLKSVQESWRHATAVSDGTAVLMAGDLEVVTAAVGNSASVTIDGAGSIVSEQSTHWGRIRSTTSVVAGDIAGDLSATSASIANSLTAALDGDTDLHNSQAFQWGSESRLAVEAEGLAGDVDLTSAALGNSASLDVGEADRIAVHSIQQAAYDPSAFMVLSALGVGGHVAATTAALANSLGIATGGQERTLRLRTLQRNQALTQAHGTLAVGSVSGSVTATAAAIGNSVSVTTGTPYSQGRD